MEVEKIQVDKSGHGRRIDIFLAEKLQDRISRSQIKKHIDEGSVKIAGNKVTAHAKLKLGDEIEFEWMEKAPEGVRAEDIPLEILFEDNEIIVIKKPAGMVVHPAYANPDHTLVNALLFHFRTLSHTETIRPGLVHRLDKDTSGVMVVAKNDRAHAKLAKQFKNHTVEKIYYAFVRGVVQHEEGICEAPVSRSFVNRKKLIVTPSGGKDAETFFRVKKRFKNVTWLEVFPKTGRTHQIRVHMNHLDHPILGDVLYGAASPLIGRQALHACALSIDHPTTGKRMKFEAEMPEDLKMLVEALEKSLQESD